MRFTPSPADDPTPANMWALLWQLTERLDHALDHLDSLHAEVAALEARVDNPDLRFTLTHTEVGIIRGGLRAFMTLPILAPLGLVASSFHWFGWGR